MAGVVTITGAVAPPQVLGQYVGGSGVAFNNAGGLAFDAPASLNKGINLYDETNQFIAALVGALTTAGVAGVTPVAIIDQLLLILASMRRQPTMTTGVRVVNP